MSDEDPGLEHLLDFATGEASRIIAQSNGTGASLDSPVHLGVINPLVAPTIEHAIVTIVYGVKDRDWFDAGRQYHRNQTVCEQRIQVAPTVTPEWSNKPGGVYSMFFDLSDVSDTSPIPAQVRPFFSALAAQAPVRDSLFASRFPLVAVNADCAMEAARIIAGYLAQANAEGWTIGNASALVDDWRNEYALTRAGKKPL